MQKNKKFISKKKKINQIIIIMGNSSSINDIAPRRPTPTTNNKIPSLIVSSKQQENYQILSQIKKLSNNWCEDYDAPPKFAISCGSNILKTFKQQIRIGASDGAIDITFVDCGLFCKIDAEEIWFMCPRDSTQTQPKTQTHSNNKQYVIKLVSEQLNLVTNVASKSSVLVTEKLIKPKVDNIEEFTDTEVDEIKDFTDTDMSDDDNDVNLLLSDDDNDKEEKNNIDSESKRTHPNILPIQPPTSSDDNIAINNINIVTDSDSEASLVFSSDEDIDNDDVGRKPTSFEVCMSKSTSQLSRTELVKIAMLTPNKNSLFGKKSFHSRIKEINLKLISNRKKMLQQYPIDMNYLESRFYFHGRTPTNCFIILFNEEHHVTKTFQYITFRERE